MKKPSDKKVAATKLAYRGIYKQYVANNPHLNDNIRHSLDRFIAYLPGEVVLDVGCAGGRETEYLHEHGLAATGCDISEDFIRVARERCPDCEFFVADMRHIDGRTNSFDGLWANASFLHIPKSDALSTLKSFSRLLKSSGILYLSVMEGDFDDLRENKQMKWVARHFSDYQDGELGDLLGRAGFEILDQSSNGTSWGPTFLHYFCKRT